VIVPGPSDEPSLGDLQHRLEVASAQTAAARERARELLQWTRGALAGNRVLRQALGDAIRDRQPNPARPEVAQQREFAQMAARLQTMPVIEQAKGIIMTQSHCGGAEAFEILRRVSQQSNVPVRELAAQIVAKAAG
jgi:hypothetical protein